MRRFEVAAVSINTTPLDFSGNLSLHINALESTETKNSSVVVFPELSLSGYGCEDAFYRPIVWKKSRESLEKLLPYSQNKLIVVGLPFFLSPYLYNVSAILFNGKVEALIPKKNLANTGIHYEKRWFTEWEGGIRTENGIRLGDTVIDWNGLRIALEICEDSWVLHRPSQLVSEWGIDLVLSPGASHFSMGKYEIRSRIFLESSRVQENAFVFANLIGNESGRVIFDGGNIIAVGGKPYALGSWLKLGDVHITRCILDLDEIHQNKSKNFRKSSEKKFSDLDKDTLQFLEGSPFNEKLISSIPYAGIPEENIYKSFASAEILGLFDYLRKSKTKGYTLSLSGGADSSTLAILVSAMEEEVKLHLGKNYWEENGYSRPLLTTIYQKTRNNSESTQLLARNLAEELGAKHYEIEIDSEVDSMTQKISDTIGRELNWEEDNLSLQNIQARARSPLVWLLANTSNHLLLSTGNRSESSVGYTTMDGDSSGSLAPLTGVSKKFILDWLHYASQHQDPRIPKCKALESLLDSKPTAELKPLEMHQEDETDLMPYPILHRIEYLAIHQGKAPHEIGIILQTELDGYSFFQIEEMVNKFYTLFRVSQWKRERLPPSFHLDEYGLDPKSSYRFPILSGGMK